MANFVENDHFSFFWVRYGSHYYKNKQDPIAGHSWPQKMAIFDKIGHKKFKFYFLVKILTCPNSLSVRASTDVKSGQKFQLEPG